MFQNFSNTSNSSVAFSPIPITISCQEVYVLLRSLPNKEGGPDGLPSWIFKDSADFLSSAICLIFNRSFQNGRFPSCFKAANIVPIPKCSRPHSISDYRPISMLPILSKLLERFVVKKLIVPSVIDRVNTSQFAYLPRLGSGTVPALVTVYHKIVHFLDSSSGAVRLLSTDFSKAFDKLPHHVILDACRRFHLPDSVVGWVSSFLSNRKQRVVINNCASEWVSIPSGVPQGSVLGPILFCLALDNLKAVCDNSMIVKYADDVLLLHFVRHTSDDRLQKEFDNILTWSSSSHLPLNLDKCCVLDFITKRSLSLSPVRSNSSYFLQQVDTLSFLGVTFSSSFKWNAHFNRIIKKASSRIFILRNLRRGGCPPFLMWKCYLAIIRSVLLYAFPCMCNAPKYLLKRLESVERRALLIINDNNFCGPPLMTQANILCERLFSQIDVNPEHPLRDLFVTRSLHRTRCSKSLQRPFAKTKRFSCSFIKFCK